MLPPMFAPFCPLKNRHINHGYMAPNLSTIKLCLATPKGFIGSFLKNLPIKHLGVAGQTSNGFFRLIS